ncbi:hypothetical protein [Luteibaculum oceani]|uniref:DUF4199 domain-containing protein n=1 Tax=Luteibaculum oceani TaxID=1294296 RepID=A0A5C6VA72_9FLAO|nr:hypothetical protein [Luteibaculum oceani]TXC81674.1 hypothetical protein FRX97_03930 [Luteibaculum oceani]
MATSQQIAQNFGTEDSKLLTATTIAGIFICISFIGFFLIMQALNLAGMVWLRSFNGVFLGLGIWLILRHFRDSQDHKLEFLDGIRIGLRTTVIAVLPFSFFMFLVLSLNTGFLEYIQQNAWCGEFVTPISAAGMLSIEGIISGFMMSYVFMMSLKRS